MLLGGIEAVDGNVFENQSYPWRGEQCVVLTTKTAGEFMPILYVVAEVTPLVL